jgi:alkyldihydroxyacetonephosphate synthase
VSAWLQLDRPSLLVHVAANAPLAELQAALDAEGLSLEVEIAGTPTVVTWLEAGAPGARNAWLDPADHLLAGFSARIRATGDSFAVHPAPRRAVGPDLASLLSGVRGRWLTLESVWLRVHRKDAPRPRTAPFEGDDPTLDPSETALFDAIDEALR